MNKTNHILFQLVLIAIQAAALNNALAKGFTPIIVISGLFITAQLCIIRDIYRA